MQKCKNGHPLSDENFHISPSGHKRCRACSRLSSSKWRKKNLLYLRRYLKDYRRKKK